MARELETVLRRQLDELQDRVIDADVRSASTITPTPTPLDRSLMVTFFFRGAWWTNLRVQ